MATSHSNSRSLLLLVLISGFFITGILFDYMPIILDNQLKRHVELASNEQIQTIWSKPPIDIHSYYWLYNITNPEQFMNGEKIRVQKVGPFHFTSRAEKTIIELSANKYRIIYNSTRHLHFNESEHELSYEQWKNSPTSNTNNNILTKVDDNLTLINAAFATMVEASRELASKADIQTRPMLIAAANRLAEKFNETLIMNLTARQALMGRKLIFVEKARKMIETFGLDNKLPNVLDNDIFGYVAVQNGTQSGPYEIYTGYQASMSSLGDIISFQGKRRYNEYRGKCNRLQASAGELRPMPIIETQVLEMSVPGFCRILHLHPTGLRKLREGIAIAYTHHQNDFKNSTYNRENECFCVNGTVDNYCSLNGAIELAPCSYYSPIVLTTNIIEPDPRITSSVADYEPELLMSDVDSVPKADNQAQLLILRRIGVPAKADITYTLFGKVIRDPKFRQTASVPEVSYIPLVMVREMAEIPQELGQIVVNLENFLALTQHMKVIMYLSSIVLLLWLTGHYYNRSSHDRVVPSAGSWHNSAGALGQTNDSIAPSERANSADSNRSQPPSRIMSRAGSIEINEGRVASATSAANQQVISKNRESKRKSQVSSLESMSNQQKASYNNKDNSGNTKMMSSNNETTKSNNGLQQQPQQQQNLDNDQSTRIGRLRGARFFSKVDEEMENSKQTSGNKSAKSKPKLNEQKLADSMQNQLGRSDSTTNYPLKNSDLSENVVGNETDNLDKTKENDPKQVQRNKNWIMKVVARILSGIKGTISEASQLDIRDNDYHDKQLEMLAGKIDNWYNSNANAASTTAAAAAAAAELEAKLERKDDFDGSGSGENDSTTTQLDVHDQNTNDLGLKCGLKTDTQAKPVVDSGKLGDQANNNGSSNSNSNNNNKAQVNNSESCSKKAGSKNKELFKVGEDKLTGGEVVVLDDKTKMKIEANKEKDIKEESEEDKEKKDKEKGKRKGKDENNKEKGEDRKLEPEEQARVKKTAENQEKDGKELDGGGGGGEDDDDNGDEKEDEGEDGGEGGGKKMPHSQTGSIRRKRTIKKKTGGEKAREFEPINGNNSTPVELIDKESFADSKLNLTNSSGTQTELQTQTQTQAQLEKTELAKLNSEPTLEQPEELDSKVNENSSQTDLLPATMANGVDVDVDAPTKSNTLQTTLAQNLTSSRVDSKKIDDRGGGGEGKGAEEDKGASIEKVGEEEEVEEQDESSNGNVTRNGTCVETNHNNRPDSVQSNQRIINKSDTSGDESVEAASLVSAKQNKEDKAAAFEQIEMAMAIAQ